MTFVHLRGQPLWPRTQSNGIRKKLNIHAHDEGPLSTPKLGHRVLRAQGAVAEAPHYPDVASLPTTLPPAVLKLPELPVLVLSIAHGRNCMSVVSSQSEASIHVT